MEDEIKRLNDRVSFLMRQLHDAEALLKCVTEQRDDFRRKLGEERSKCLRIASERNRLRRERDNAVEFDDRR